jgi:hypothetical protein
MQILRLALSLLTLVTLALLSISCGSSSNQQLQSVTVTPSVADASTIPVARSRFWLRVCTPIRIKK